MDTPARAREDACPGVFAVHDAADGALARVRLPGGAVSAAQLTILAGCAEDLGDGFAHLTSRGNIQLRGLDRGAPLVPRLAAAGLLPSPAHERVRNILASPLSEQAAVLAAQLDQELCARPELAALPGRFLFALDGGGGDISGEGADVCWRAVDDTGALLLDGVDTGLRVPAEAAVEAVLQVAHEFLALRGSAWRVRELADRRPLLRGVRGTKVEPVEMTAAPGLPIGVLDQGLGVAPVFGQLSSGQLRLIAEVAERAVVTPWRSLLLPGVRDSSPLAAAGLVVDPDAASTSVSACIGHPGCAKSRADVRADASKVLPGLPARLRAHFAGCERRCGKPAGQHVDVLAEDGGYRVDGVWVRVAELTESLLRKGLELPSKREMTGYLRDGAEIYRHSFATIRAEADLAILPEDVAYVAVRMIHACGMVDLVDDLRYTFDVVEAGREALAGGAPVLCDATMIASGVTRGRLPADNEILCTLSDPKVASLAERMGTTRSAAALELWRDKLAGSVVAIGNAPTALFRLLEMIEEGAGVPAAILGLPVGFVGAAESKEELVKRAPAPYLVVRGRRGGSAMAVAAINALASEVE